MNPQIFSHLRLGLIALGVLAGLSVPASAAPLGGFGGATILPATSEKLPGVELVGGGQFRYHGWNDDEWRYRRHHRRHHRRHYNVYPQFYLGLGVPTYRYYAPPRRYYRQRLGSAHVAWCYDRWLSYRAWDNTYQPLYGPRRQCWSPYS